MSMTCTVGATDRKPRATTANHMQRPLAIHAEAPPPQPPQELPHGPLVTSSFNDVPAHAALHAELDHEEIAEQMGCELVRRDSKAQQIAALKAQLADLQREVA